MKTKFKQTEIGKIPEDWEVKKLGETLLQIIDGDRGVNYPKQNEFYKKGYCLFLNTKNVPNDKFNFQECSFITKEKDNLLRKGKLFRGDIVLTTRGTIGNLALFSDAIQFEVIRINSGMVIIRNNANIFDTNFLYLLLRSPIIQNQFKSVSTGSAQPQLPVRDLNKVNLVVPPLQEQRAIAKILSDLDDKIELLQKQNKTLEKIGQAIFKHWFVDFEFPDENGKPYKSSGGEMVKSELGEIPKGWEVKKLDKLGDFKNGINYDRNEVGDSEYYIVNVRDIVANRLLAKYNLGKLKINSKKAEPYLINKQDILIVRSASPGEIALVFDNLENIGTFFKNFNNSFSFIAFSSIFSPKWFWAKFRFHPI